MTPLIKGCPKLTYVDLSGDSWVTHISMTGLSEHPFIQSIKLGHFEHGDLECEKFLNKKIQDPP